MDAKESGLDVSHEITDTMYMLIWKERLDNCPVMSLQTGGELGTVTEPIIDPRDLRIVAFYVVGPLLADSLSVLHTEDIREYGSLGMIVNDSDDIMAVSDELVRLKQIIDYKFSLIGMRVVDTQRKKLGKVSDYVVDSTSFLITKFSVKAPLLGGVGRSDLLIGREQIREINNDEIVVAAPTVKEHRQEKITPAPLPAFDNPFRSTRPEGS